MEEKILQTKKNGMAVLLLTLVGYVAAIAAFVLAVFQMELENYILGVPLLIVSIVYVVAGIFVLCGLRVLKPQEALVLTLFGDYIGTLKGQGFYWVNPFCTAVNPAAGTRLSQSGDVNNGENTQFKAGGSGSTQTAGLTSKKISLKMMTLNNSRQKINDCLGNPVEIGIAVIWRVTDTAKAVFHVDNYKEYLSLQCDSALRNVVRVYPYDVSPNVDTTGDGVADEGSLRGSSEVVAKRIQNEIQKNVTEAGIEIIDARKMIVDGAVGMVEMALERLNENKVVELDDERKAAMVSNLLVVLCGNRDAQPIVNSGSLY
jgi:regulator of protease activity HflC (stomatin/prohibitin superfamily)